MTTLLDNSTLIEAIKPAECRSAEDRKPAVDPLYERTEDQLAMEFAETYGDKLRYDHARNTWFVWDGNRWKPDADGLAYRMALKLARARWNRAWTIPETKLQEAAGRWAVKSRTFKILEGTLKAASS
jgi:phage/plasmid-associated DNA primase